MPKKTINQKVNYDLEMLNSIGSNFIFDNNPIIIKLCEQEAEKMMVKVKEHEKVVRDNSAKPRIMYVYAVNDIFKTFLGRPPIEEENKKARAFVCNNKEYQKNLAKFIQIIICTGEFRNVK